MRFEAIAPRLLWYRISEDNNSTFKIMKQVTYGVADLIDWNARIPVGKACMSVHFTGGALTKYGVTPAEFTTADPFTQRVIEDSEYFRSGRIAVLRSIGRPDVRPASRKEGIVEQKAFLEAVLPVDDSGRRTGEIKEVEVSCLEDAMEYLRAHFSVPTYRLRNMAVVRDIAASNGVRFVFPDTVSHAKP